MTMSMIPVEAFAKIDEFSEQYVSPPGSEPALEACTKNAKQNGLPDISVSAMQGKFLMLQAKMMKAKRILEIGTLAGYSTIWFGKALEEDGEIITLESNEKFVELSRQNIANAKLKPRVEVIHGSALETLDKLEGKFDLVFIDADKQNSANYLKKAVELTGSGSVIFVDNTIRDIGIILDENSTHHYAAGIRAVYPTLQQLQNEGLIMATNFQTAGSKGHDGLGMCLRT